MKTGFRILTVFLFLLNFHLTAQEYIASNAKLSKEAIGKISSVSANNAVVSLNEQTNTFAFSVHLFPILTTPLEHDTIATLNQKVVMSYRADFPIKDLDFFDTGKSGKQYTMDGDLTVNNITKPVKLNFYLIEGLPQDINSRDIHSYPVRISLALEINPADYNLDIETAKFTEKIIVMIENGIINRTNQDPESQN